MYLNYINSFRGIAIIFVVITHVLIPFEAGLSKEVYGVLLSLFQDSTVLFVFISGFLFQHLLKKYSYLNFIKTKIKYVVVPYLFVSIPGILHLMISGSNISLTKLLTVIFSGYLIPGTMQILWFIPMIVLFFIVSPLFRFIDSNPKLYIYLIPTTLIISTLITRGINPLVNFILFISVYLLGMLTSHYRENADDLLNKNIHLLHFLFLVFTGLDIFNIYTNNFYNPLGNNIFLRFWAKLLLSGILLHYLLKFDLMLNNKLNLYAKYSFGIFFIHGYVITIYNKILPDTFFNKNSIFFFVIFFMLVFFTTLGILVATKKTLHKYSRYVIGV